MLPTTLPANRKQAAFTLIELVIVIAIVAALAAIALPSYRHYVDQMKIDTAIKDISEISLAIEQYHSANLAYPASLAVLGGNLPTTDPWGHAYQYLAIDVTPSPNRGAVRKDRWNNPLNSDYDLYSMGPDGQTQPQLTASKARDDVVRAGNGSFIGVATDY